MIRINRACPPLVRGEPTILDRVVVLPRIRDSFHGEFLVSTEHRVYALDMTRRLIVEAPSDPEAPDGPKTSLSPRFNKSLPHLRPISRVHQCVEGRLLYLALRSEDGIRDEVYFAPHVTMILFVPHLPEEWMP